MGKLLFWLIVGLLIWLVAKGLARRRVGKSQPVAEVEDMVRCAVCGVNLPRSEALLSRGRFYCGQAHREQDQDPGQGPSQGQDQGWNQD